MSDSDSASLQEEFFEFSISVLSNYVVLLAASLWIYEYFLTFWMEFSNVWTKRWSAMSLLYLVNRYSFFFSCTAQAAMFLLPGRSQSFCQNMYYPALTFQSVAGLSTALLFAFRVYALYDRALSVLVVLGTVIVAKRVQNIWSIVMAMGVQAEGIMESGFPDDNVIVCVFTTRSDANLTLFSRFQTSIVFTELLFDTLVFTMTVRKTYQHSVEMRKAGESSVAQLILRDGVIYYFFSLLTSIAVAGTQLYSTTNDTAGLDVTSGFFLILTPLYNTLPNILANRLYLNLKEYNPPNKSVNTTDTGPVTQLEFAHSDRILGNIGGPLQTLDDDNDYDVDATDSSSGAEDGEKPVLEKTQQRDVEDEMCLSSPGASSSREVL